MFSILSLTLLLSCQSKDETANMNQKRDFRYLALGDSYTIGESVTESESWPMQLADSLRARGYPFTNPGIIAKTGWTTDELSVGIEEVNPAGPYDLVSLLIGVNNQYRGRDLDEYRIQFKALLNKAIQFAKDDATKVFVLSIPDWGVTPFAKGRDQKKIVSEIDAYNQVNLEETKLMGAYYIDITGISREAKIDSTLIAKDGLHPSGKMYAKWVQLVLPKAELILKKTEIQ